jgi:hypothetical protein
MKKRLTLDIEESDLELLNEIAERNFRDRKQHCEFLLYQAVQNYKSTLPTEVGVKTPVPTIEEFNDGLGRTYQRAVVEGQFPNQAISVLTPPVAESTNDYYIKAAKYGKEIFERTKEKLGDLDFVDIVSTTQNHKPPVAKNKTDIPQGEYVDSLDLLFDDALETKKPPVAIKEKPKKKSKPKKEKPPQKYIWREEEVTKTYFYEQLHHFCKELAECWEVDFGVKLPETMKQKVAEEAEAAAHRYKSKILKAQPEWTEYEDYFSIMIDFTEAITNYSEIKKKRADEENKELKDIQIISPDLFFKRADYDKFVPATRFNDR